MEFPVNPDDTFAVIGATIDKAFDRTTIAEGPIKRTIDEGVETLLELDALQQASAA